jgi:hypothetical protein
MCFKQKGQYTNGEPLFIQMWEAFIFSLQYPEPYSECGLGHFKSV